MRRELLAPVSLMTPIEKKSLKREVRFYNESSAPQDSMLPRESAKPQTVLEDPSLQILYDTGEGWC